MEECLIGKFLGQGFPIDFVHRKEMRARWDVEGHFHISPLSGGFLLFEFPSEAVKDRVLEKGSWSLTGQLLSLESWRPNFRPGTDSVRHAARIWVHLPDLPLELWEAEKILKLVSVAGTPLFVDEWTAMAARMGFARVAVLVDITKPNLSRHQR